MKIDNDILTYFSQTDLSPIFKVDRIDDLIIKVKVDKLLNTLPKAEYEEVLNSEKWKWRFGKDYSEDRAKVIWLKQTLINAIDKLRINMLKIQASSDKPSPYHLEQFNDIAIDKDNLIDISSIFRNKPYSSQTFIIDDMKFALCQSIGGVNSSYWLARSLKSLAHSGHKVYARLDPLMYNSFNKFEDIEYQMQVWGKDLHWDKLTKIRSEEHGQWLPDLLGCITSLRTDYVWRPTAKEIHLTIEELPKIDLVDIRGSRYLHAIFDKNKMSFVHCDGAMRIFDEHELENRLNCHLKQPEVTKIGKRIKLFNIKSTLSIREVISLTCNFFVWNTDIIEYLTNSKMTIPNM